MTYDKSPRCTDSQGAVPCRQSGPDPADFLAADPSPSPCGAPGCHACQSGKFKRRPQKELRALVNRLSRVEGQVRGIKRMVEEDAYCVDIVTQVSAVCAALNAFNRELMGAHIKTCVADGVRNGNDEVIDELVGTLQKLMK